MKLNTSLIIASTSLTASVQAFAPSANNNAFMKRQLLGGDRIKDVVRGCPLYAMSETEIAALKAQAAKAREEADRLAKEMGKTIEKPKEVEVIEKKNLSTEELSSRCASIAFDGDASLQVSKLDDLVAKGEFSMWKKAQRETENTTNLFRSLRTYPVSLNMLEQRTGGRITAESLGVDGEMDVNLDDFKDATIAVTLGSSGLAVAALAFLPENIGATVCYLIALVPVAWIAVGSSAPGIIAGAIVAARGEGDDSEERDDRICRHEAAHFLCGYVCGLPIKDYSLSDSGFPCVEFFESSEGESSRELESEEIAALSVVSMSGSVAESLKFDQAKGGENDLIQLQSFFRRSKEFVGAAKQQDLTRWGALASYQILNDYRKEYEALIDAFKAKKSVSECVAIIEGSS